MDLQATRVAWKRLSAVEVKASRSHQHEFNFSKARAFLGITDPVVEGSLQILFYRVNGVAPELDEAPFTLYDSRRAKSHRSSEFRLYYYSERMQDLAQEGDLLVVMRQLQSRDLLALVIAAGTKVEQQVLELLASGDNPSLKGFFLTAPPPAQLELIEAAAGPSAAPDRTATAAVTAHPLYVRSVARRTKPSTKEMAEAAQELVRSSHGEVPDPDQYIQLCLDQETELYMAIEQAIAEAEYRELVQAAAPLESVFSFVQSHLQSRRSRRGSSLEHHVEAVLQRAGVRFTPQCPTEGGIADFVVPGRKEYEDPQYPDEALRMVGCKSRLRERWSQYVREAMRVRTKYHVSLDTDLSDGLITDMDAAGLRLYMPASLRDRSYRGSKVREKIGSISELLVDLRSVAENA